MRKILLVIFIALFLGLQVSCDAWSVVGGTVYDSQNKPIEGASVQFAPVGIKSNKEIWYENAVTGKDGKFHLRVGHGMWGTDLRVIVAKDGYKIAVKEMTASEIQDDAEAYNNLKVVLEKNE